MKKVLLSLLVLNLFFAVSAQTRSKKNVRPADKPPVAAETPKPVPAQTPTPESTPQEKIPQKKNTRDDSQSKAKPDEKVNLETAKEIYHFEFAQPNFPVKKVVIDHDENGRGRISFEEKDFDEAVTEKLQLSAATLEKIKTLFRALNFLDSTESYQSTVRNYPHLGTRKIALKSDGKERNIEYNWTENADMKTLGEEYSKLGYQLVWESDIKVARENQPLRTPELVETLDIYLRQGYISDPPELLPFMKELSNDERLPLLARNHMLRLIKSVEKTATKKDK